MFSGYIVAIFVAIAIGLSAFVDITSNYSFDGNGIIHPNTQNVPQVLLEPGGTLLD